MKLRLYFICIAAFLVLALHASAADNSTAKVYGGVYNSDTFEPLDNAIVDVNSTPSQSMLAKSGVYSFELEPGNYFITARYYQNNNLTYSATEYITIKNEGSYRLDLLLLPVYSEELMEDSAANSALKNLSQGPGETGTLIASNKTNASNSAATVPIQTGDHSTGSYLIIAITLLLLLAGGYVLYSKHHGKQENELQQRKIGPIKGDIGRAGNVPEFTEKTTPVSGKKEYPVQETDVLESSPGADILESSSIDIVESKLEAEFEESYSNAEIGKPGSEAKKETFSVVSADNSEIQVSAPEKKLPLPADLQEILDIIRGHGGRITQKDLRSRLKHSEGKVSLMLADLERRNLIEKFKRGRGNVVILKDEER